MSFSLSNPIGAADLLVNGASNIKGWGMQVSPDPALLYVRGFDAGTNKYKYYLIYVMFLELNRILVIKITVQKLYPNFNFKNQNFTAIFMKFLE